MTASVDTNEMLRLSVARADEVAEGIRLFELRHQKDAVLPQFTPGSHLTVRVPNGELRKYSLCNNPAELDRYMIAVKRDEQGRGGSISMVDAVKAGDVLEVSAPTNDF